MAAPALIVFRRCHTLAFRSDTTPNADRAFKTGVACAHLNRPHSASEILFSPTMVVIWVHESEDRKMDAKKTREFRLQLLSKQEKLIKSIGRCQNAEDEIGGVKTEDEGDLATISQERDILYSLHESVFMRLRFIQEPLHASASHALHFA